MKRFDNFLKIAAISAYFLFSAIVSSAVPTWTRVNYTSSTAFIGKVMINHYDAAFPITVEAGDYIGAFVGDECRMVAEVFAYNGSLYVSSVIQGGDVTDMTGSTSDPEEVEWKVWDNSANKLITTQVKGTLFTKSAGEIFDYEIGKPNTGSELKSLAITSYTLDPTFSAATTEYEITVPYGTTLPAESAYTAVAADSRASVTVSAATSFNSENIAETTITVTAEDGTKTEYVVTFIQEGCTATAPTSSEIKDANFCYGDASIQLTASFSNESYKAVWYEAATGGTALVTSNTFEPSNTSVGTKTYYAAKNDGICESDDRLAVTVTITKAATPTVTSATVEQNGAVPALQASGSGTIKWYESETGSSIASGTSFTPSVSTASEETFTYYATNTENNCESEKVAVTLSVTSCATEAPTIDAVDAICEGDAFPTLKATGTNISWYDVATDGSQIATGATYTPTKAGTYYASQNPSCEGPRASVVVEVKSKPATPVATGASSCGGSTLTAMSTDVSANWYADKTATALVTDSKSYTPSGITKTTTYYVKQVVDGCSSDWAEVTYTIANKPSKPQTDATEACYNSKADYIVRVSGSLAQGATLQWYDENGTPQGTKTIQDVAVTEAKVYTYTVSQVIGECVSEPATATLTVHALPEPSLNVLGTYCTSDSKEVVLSASITGGDFTVDGLIAESFIPSELSKGSHTIAYFVEDEYGCYGESEKTFTVSDCSEPDVETISLDQTSLSLLKGESSDALQVTITPDDAPKDVEWTSSDSKVATVDENGVVTAVGAGKAVITVTSSYTGSKSATCSVEVVAPVESVTFNNPSAISVVENEIVNLAGYLVINPSDASIKSVEWSSSSSVAFVDKGAVSAGSVDEDTDVTITVKVTSQDGTSKSTSITITVTNEETPCELSAPVVKKTSQSVCSDSGESVTFEAMGDNSASWVWIDESNKTVATASSFTTKTPGAYYVYQTTAECESPKSAVIFTEKTKPATPTISNVSVCEGEKGTFVSTSASTIWYSSENVELSTGKTYSPTTAGTYYAKQETDGCMSDAATITYTINAMPTFSVNNQSSVLGATVPNLTVTTASSNTVTWYYNNVQVGTGSSFATNQTAVGLYTYYVTVANAAGCTSEKTAVTLQITDCDLDAPTVSNATQSVCEGAANPSFTASGSNSFVWYSDASLTNKVGSSASYKPTDSDAGTYNYYVTQKSTCESPAKKVTLVINALPKVSISAASSLETTDSPVTISTSPVGGTLSGTGVSGSKFDPSVGAGTYTITYTYEDVNGCSNSATAKITVTKGITIDRKQLGDTIARANAIVSLYIGDDSYPVTAKNTFTQAISVAQAYYDKYENYTQNQINQQVTSLSKAIQAFLNSKVEKLDISILQQKISEALLDIQSNEYRKGNEAGYIPEASFTMLQNAITTASNIVANPPKTQAEVKVAVSVLQSAIDAFFASVIPNKVEKIEFTESRVNLIAGDEYTPTLIYTPVGSTTDLLWTSSNTEVVNVTGGGKIVAKKAGSVAVTATSVDNPAISTRLIIVVTEKPVLESVSMNKLGNQLYLQFSEDMAAPKAEIYTDIFVYGKKIPMYNILDVSTWPLDPKRIVITLGNYIDNPNDVTIVYKGNSLSSVYGGPVVNFEYSMNQASIDDIAENAVVAYPTVASSVVSISGLTIGEQITVVSGTGKIVLSQQVDSDVEQLQIDGLVAGTYYVMVYYDNKLVAKVSFIKK